MSSVPQQRQESNHQIDWNDLQDTKFLKHGSGTSLLTAWLRPPNRNRDDTDSSHDSSPNSPIPVVVKTAKEGVSAAETASVTQELQQEAQVLSALSHPHIIKFYGCGFRNPSPDFQASEAGAPAFFLVLERLDGGTLGELLQARSGSGRLFPFSLGQKNSGLSYMDQLHYAEALATALHYLHHVAVPDAVIIHRDLKPDNIGFGADGTLKLFDFGLSTSVPRGPPGTRLPRYRLTGHTGSVRYMAPEVALDQPYNEKVDVYGFSMVLWEMTAGRKPYSTMNVETHRREVCIDGARPAIDRSLPAEMGALLQECWAACPDSRPTLQDVVVPLHLMTRKAESAGGEQRQLPRTMSPGFRLRQSFTPKSSWF